MDEDETWHAGRPRPGDIVLDEDPGPPKRGTVPPIFGPCLLWPNGWMDQDATWYGGRPRPRQLHCVRWVPSSPPKGAQPPVLAHVYCGQTAPCIRIPLGTEAGLGPGDIVLDGTQFPPKRGTAPNFRPMSIVAKRLDGAIFHLVQR